MPPACDLEALFLRERALSLPLDRGLDASLRSDATASREGFEGFRVLCEAFSFEGDLEASLPRARDRSSLERGLEAAFWGSSFSSDRGLSGFSPPVAALEEDLEPAFLHELFSLDPGCSADCCSVDSNLLDRPLDASRNGNVGWCSASSSASCRSSPGVASSLGSSLPSRAPGAGLASFAVSSASKPQRQPMPSWIFGAVLPPSNCQSVGVSPMQRRRSPLAQPYLRMTISTTPPMPVPRPACMPLGRSCASTSRRMFSRSLLGGAAALANLDSHVGTASACVNM